MNPDLRKLFGVLIFVLLILNIISLNIVSAQEESPQIPSDNDVNAIAKELYCPVCENIPLDVCPTQACAEWRELIRLKLSEGWDEEQIKIYFAEQYGDRVLATPPARGFSILIFIIPAVGIVVGIYLVVKALRSLQQVEEIEEVTIATDELEDKYMDQLKKELDIQD